MGSESPTITEDKSAEDKVGVRITPIGLDDFLKLIGMEDLLDQLDDEEEDVDLGEYGDEEEVEDDAVDAVETVPVSLFEIKETALCAALDLQHYKGGQTNIDVLITEAQVITDWLLKDLSV